MGTANNEMINSSQQYVSLVMDSDELISCEICLEPFHPTQLPPKLLPCGHNFCEHCLLSLCCHQQYYLLDSVNCPTCRTEFNTSTAFAAPTNYDLCKMMENVQRSANITVIHVTADQNQNQTKSSGTTRSVFSKRTWRQSFRKKAIKCANCDRKLSEKNRRKIARLCMRCSNMEDSLRLICLECCVNYHNGHLLVTVNELEYDHQKLINDLRELNKKIEEASTSIDTSLKDLTNNSAMPIDCELLRRAKESLERECQADFKFALSILENPETTPLPPIVITRMRRQQRHNEAKLQKMLNYIERYKESVNERHRRHQAIKTSGPRNSPFALTVRQSRATLHNNDCSTTVNSISAAFALNSKNGDRVKLIRQAIKTLSRKSATADERIIALISCAKHLRSSIDEKTSEQSLLVFIDAYLNIFYQLNRLISRFSSTKDTSRPDIWRLVQFAYTDLMKCASRHWPCQHPNRVDLVDDLAFLCSLYSDVCDQATITICMIEAARARAASQSLAFDEKQNQDIRLSLIDEHLLECRRIQKLQELRSAQLPERFQHIKQFWKALSACFGLRKY